MAQDEGTLDIRNFSAGGHLYKAGQPVTECFLLRSGRVRVVRRVRSSERNIGVLEAGDLVGTEALLGESLRESDAIALTDVTAIALDDETFGALLAREPALAPRLLKRFLTQIRDLESQVESSMLGDAPSRVVHALTRLGFLALQKKPNELPALRLSPLELSSRVGLDVDSVKRSIGKLRDNGYLRISNETIEILDLDALRELYGMLGRKEAIRGSRNS